jgi:hypothetical protein
LGSASFKTVLDDAESDFCDSATSFSTPTMSTSQ